MNTPPLITLLTVIWIFTAVVVADISIQFLVRTIFHKRHVTFELATLFVLLSIGVLAIHNVLDMKFTAAEPELDIPFFGAALSLYVFLVLNYFQCKSIFSRGYSIRILVDLLTRNAPDTISHMKSNYGGGMGLNGMLLKRLRSIHSVGLLYVDEKQVGPLTPRGRICALIAKYYRRLLKLEGVG